MKKLLLLITFLVSLATFAQSPYITSLTSHQGKPGDTITINGLHFGAANTSAVFWGKTRAQILSSTNNSFTIKVPNGVGNIEVDVFSNGKYGQNKSYFSYRYYADSMPYSRHFSALTKLGRIKIGNYPVKILPTYDFDLDGLPDYIIQQSGYQESLIRNTGANFFKGTISDIDLKINHNVPLNGRENAIKFVDINNDLKIDVIQLSGNNSAIDIYVNTSTPGKISFEKTTKQLSGQPNILSFEVGDLNNDGYYDFIFTSNININVAIQNPQLGFISSLDNIQRLYSAHNPKIIALADLNADYRKELIYYWNDVPVEVLSGYFIDSLQRVQPSLIKRQRIFTNYTTKFSLLKDLNQDRKPEFLFGNSSHLMNKSLNSDSFVVASNNFKPIAGDVYYEDIDGDGYEDALSNTSTLAKNNSTSTSMGFKQEETLLPFNTFRGCSSFDINDDGLSDMVCITNADEIYCRYNISTQMLITAIGSKIAMRGDRVMVTIQNNRNAVTTNNYQIQLSDSTGNFNAALTIASKQSNNVIDTIWAVIPNNIAIGNKYKIRSYATALQTYSTNIIEDIEIIEPIVLDSVWPMWGNVGDVVTIKAQNLPQETDKIKVKFGIVTAEILEVNNGIIKVRVPKGAAQANIVLEANGLLATSTLPFCYKYAMNPAELTYGNYVYYIYDGQGYSSLAVQEKMLFTNLFGNYPALALAGQYSSSLNIAFHTSGLGANSTTFNRLASGSVVLPSINPQVAAFMDLNRDGDDDGIVYSLFNKRIAIMYGAKNLGADYKVQNINTENNFKDLAVRDLNLDGKMDIVTLHNNPKQFSVYKNISNIRGLDSILFDVPYNKLLPLDIDATKLGVIDINGDNRPDIIILDSVNARINIFQNIDSANGLYSFTQVGGFSVAPKSNHIVLSDLNQDGKPDIVLSNKSNKVFYYLNNITSNISPNHFADSGFVTFISTVDRVQVVDMNNDARPDLYNYNELKANTYSGGAFSAAAFINITNPLTSVESITVCDVNLDGKSDIIGMHKPYNNGAVIKVLFANNLTKLEIINLPKFIGSPMDVKVLYNSGNTQPNNQITTTINVYELGVNPISLVYTNTQNTSAKQDTFTIPETILQEGKKYAVMLSNLYGISVVDTIEIGRIIKVSNGTKIIYAKAGGTVKIHGQNLDLVDWIRVGGKLANIKQKLNNELSLTVPVGISTQPLELGQYNQQTIKTDIVINYTFRRDTAINTRLLKERFSARSYAGRSGNLSIDLNNDGYCEIINTENPTIYDTRADSLLFAGPFAFKGIQFVDLNGDSKPDMVLHNSPGHLNESNEIRIYINATENNVLKYSNPYSILVDVNTKGFTIFDFDANGKPDIMVFGINIAGSPKFALYRNNLIGNVIKENSFVKVNETSGQTPDWVEKAEFVDLNNDGELELVTSEYRDNNKSIRVYKINSTPNPEPNCGLIYQFSIPLNYTTALSKTVYAFKDLNNDNLPELIYWNSKTALKIHHNNAREGNIDSNIFNSSFTLITSANNSATLDPLNQFLFADLDADERVDIYASYNDDNNYYLKNIHTTDELLSAASFINGTNLSGPSNKNLAPEAILDFNQDGKFDVFDDGNLLIQYEDTLLLRDFPTLVYTTGDTLPVKFDITSAYFTSGNTYHVEVSDTNGMFNDNTITIASVNSTNVDSIFAKIPENLPVSPNYKVRVRTTQPASYSVNSVDLDVRTLPKIFSFEPLKQVIGGMVTLHGKNFSPTPSNNIVYLGDVRCEIISAYSDELVVKIPQSASFDKFRVWVNNLTSTSTMWFTPIFNAVIGAQSSFVLKRLPKLNTPTSLSWGFYDLNGDGKVEYITDIAEYTFHHNTISDSLSMLYSKDNSIYYSAPGLHSHTVMRDLYGTGQLHACRSNVNCNPTMTQVNNYGEFGRHFPSPLLSFNFSGNCVSSYNNILVEDFNQDGIIDYAIDGSYGYEIGLGGNKYRFNTSPYDQAVFKTGLGNGSNRRNGNHAYDADGDSLQDLLTTSILYLNQTTRGKTDSYKITSGKQYDAYNDRWFVPFYLDNDNKMDHAIARGDSLILFRNTSNIGVITDQRISAYHAGGEIRRMLTADLNGDQINDIVTMRLLNNNLAFSIAESVKNGTTHSYNYRSLGNLPTSNHTSWSFNNVQLFTLDDIDNDGKQDVLISNVISDSSIYYFKNTTPTFNIRLYQKNYCVGDTLKASIDVSNFAFNANNIFSVQLSDALGSFNNSTTLLNTSQKGEQLIPLPSNVLAGNRYKIRVVSLSPADTGFITTDSINIGSLPNVNLFVQAGNVLCATDSVKLSVQQKGVSNLKWYKDGTYTGFTDSTITVNKTGTYLLKATSGGCTLTSIDTLIKFLPPVKSSFNLSQQLLCHGDTAAMTLSKTQGIKSYQWFKNDTLLTTQTQPLLQINSSGKYSTILVDSNDCSSEIDTNIVFNAKPVASFNITGRAINCKEDSVIITASNIHPKNTYTWHTNRVTLVTTGSSTVIKSTGSYSLLVVDSNGCSNQSPDIVIGKFSPTIAQITSNKNPVLCGNDSILLSYTTNRYLKTVYWRKNNVYSNTDTGYLKVKQPGVYGFYAIDSNNCQYTSNDLNIDSSNYPNTNLIGNVTQPLCEGDTVILSTAHQSGNQYKWFVNNIEAIGKVQPTYPVTDSLPVRVRITNNKGCSSISNDTFFVFKNSPQQSAILGLNNICSGDSIILRSTDSASSGYVWYRNNVKLNNDTLVSLKIKLNGTYGLTVKNQEGCQSSQTVKTVSYLPLPAISTTTTTMTICSGDSARLFATSDSTTGRTYTWYRNNIIENNWDTIGSCWIKNAGFYKVTVTNLAGCKRSKDIGTLTVNTRPNVIFNAIPSNSFCSNDSIRLNLYYTQGNSHVWYRNNQFFNGSSTLITVKDSASYYVVVTGNANCRTTTNVITTNKIPLPNTTFTITPNDSFCSGDSTKLSAFDQPNNQYKWYRNNMELMGQTAGELWTKQPGLYKLYVRNGSCNATSTPLTISMFNKPNTPVINVQPNIFFCVGDSTLLSTNIQTGFQYKWYLNDIELTEKVSNDMWATSGGNYQVKVSNVFCSSTSQTANITEAPLPEKPTITRISDTLYSSYTQNNNWYFNGILVASNQNYFKPTQNGIYTIEAVTNEGCKSDTANFNWTSTGLNTYSTLNHVTIYPNPSKGKVYIETAEEYRVSIFNQLGQLVYDGMLLPDITNTISLNLEAGVYTFNLSNQKNTYTTKLVITN